MLSLNVLFTMVDRVRDPRSTVLECVQQPAVLRAPWEDRPDVDDFVAFNDMVDVEVADGERRVAREQLHRAADLDLLWKEIPPE
jgi:hypothetical protein